MAHQYFAYKVKFTSLYNLHIVLYKYQGRKVNVLLSFFTSRDITILFQIKDLRRELFTEIEVCLQHVIFFEGGGGGGRGWG